MLVVLPRGDLSVLDLFFNLSIQSSCTYRLPDIYFILGAIIHYLRVHNQPEHLPAPGTRDPSLEML